MTRAQAVKCPAVLSEAANEPKVAAMPRKRKTHGIKLPPLPNQADIDMRLGQRCVRDCRMKVA
jgi:hypothetical protein